MVFFYEGNDIYDNIQFLQKNLALTGGIPQKQIKIKSIQEFLNMGFEKTLNKKLESSLWKNMIFTRTLIQGTLNLVDEWTSSNKKPKTNDLLHKVLPKGAVNTVVINQKKVRLAPHHSLVSD